MAVVTFPFNGRNTNGETRTLDCDGEFSGHYSYYTVTLSLARSIGANLSKNLENARRSNNTYKSARLTMVTKNERQLYSRRFCIQNCAKDDLVYGCLTENRIETWRTLLD